MKRSRGKRRGILGINGGISRDQRRFHSSQSSDALTHLISKQKRQLLLQCSQTAWKHTIQICSACCLIPFEISACSYRASELISRRKWFMYYSALMANFFIAILRTAITLYKVCYEEINLSTYLCTCTAIIGLGSSALSIGTTCAPKSVRCILNSWQPFLQSQEASNNGRPLQIFGSADVCLKILGITLTALMTSLNASAFSLAYDSLPVCVYPMARYMGLIPEVGLPTTLWQIAFFPLEVATMLPACLAANFSINVVVLSIGITKNSTQNTRQKEIVSRGSWKVTYNRYLGYLVYAGLLMEYIKVFAAPAIFLISAGVTTLMYVTVRPSGLPALVHIWFPIAAFLILWNMNWLVLDAVSTKRNCDDVLCNLQSKSSKWLARLDKRDRQLIAKRARALRPLRLMLGEFAEISIEVSFDIWDEILNQLLFLLSL